MVSPTGLLEVGILVGGTSVNWKTRMCSVSAAGAAPSAHRPPPPGSWKPQPCSLGHPNCHNPWGAPVHFTTLSLGFS